MRAQILARAALPAVLLLSSLPAGAAWPPSPGASPETLADPASWPDDPGFAQAWHLFGFSPTPLGRPVPAGMSVDAAFALTRGDPRVVVALLSTGVHWGDPELVTRFALSRGELPPPQDAQGQTALGPDPHDRNGDGRFDVRDFTSAGPGELPTLARIVDPRLTSRADGGDANGNGLLDPQDLLRIFGNGEDTDGNGLVDDVCGWDFWQDDADAEDPYFDSQGARYAQLLSAEANNAQGSLGTCPQCPLLPIRVAQGSLAQPGVLARALVHAAREGAAVVVVPGSVAQRSSVLERALDQVEDLGALVVAAAIGPSSLPPHPAVLLVTRVGPDAAQPSTYLSLEGCGDAPSFVDLAASAPGCASEAAATAGGVAGLVASAALAFDPEPLRPGALFHLLRLDATAVDPSAPWTSRTGPGRLHARAAVERAQAGLRPPTLRAPSPSHRGRLLLAEPFLPSVETPPGTAATLEIARGRDPALADFVSVHGPLEPGSLPCVDATFTLRARAGGASELRWQVVSHPSSSLLARLPLGAASPRFIDLDRDGEDELVFPGLDGQVHVVDFRGQPFPGFPLPALADARGDATLVAPIAAADLELNDRTQLVVATLEGRLFALRSNGSVAFEALVEGGMSVAPVVVPSALGPLVLAVSHAGMLHAFRSNGAPLVGFPFQLPLAQVFHTPAAADLDGDAFPEVVLVGLGEDGVVRAVLVHIDGGGARVRQGWPIEVEAAGSPVLADFGALGQVAIALPRRFGPPALFDLQGQVLRELWTDPPGAAGGPSSELMVVDVDRNRRLELFGALGEGAALWEVGEHLRRRESLSALPVPQHPGFPYPSLRPLAGTGGAAADLDGDGEVDLLFGAGEALWALSGGGTMPEPLTRFPEALGAALRGSPAVGVQDERLVFAATSLDGFVYLFGAFGQPDRIQWDGAHHDQGHTGAFATPLPERVLPAIGIDAPPLLDPGCGCSCSQLPGAQVGLGALIGLFALGAGGRSPRRRR